MMNNVPGAGMEGGHWGSGPRCCVEGEKVTERKKYSESQKGI